MFTCEVWFVSELELIPPQHFDILDNKCKGTVNKLVPL